MITTSGTTLPDHISADMAWDAYDQIIQKTDWRVAPSDPDKLTFDIEGDDTFTGYLRAKPTWKAREEAQHLLAQRLHEMAHTDLTKTSIRRWSIQVPETGDDPTEFVKCLRERLVITLRNELNAHFRQSLPRWESEAFDHWARMCDDVDQQRFYQYSGLDQVVPVDVARKALKFVFNRLHWGIIDEPDGVRFHLDYRSDTLRKRRFSWDDQTRARATVLRAVEALYHDWDTRRAQGEEVAPMSRLWLKDSLCERFEADGCWSAIHLALRRDRYLYDLVAPDMSNPETKRLLDDQDGRLFG